MQVPYNTRGEPYKNPVHLSIVTTLYNSEPHLGEFHRRMSAAAAALTGDYELILVNDGSPDGSLDAALALYEADPRVRVIDLSRNFGHHKAMMTGLAHARGDLVFLIDCDLEEDPHLLIAFAAALARSGADVVYGVQTIRKGRLLERAAGALFYTIFNLLSETKIPVNVVTARLMTRRYTTALLGHMERELNIAGLWALTGFTQIPMSIEKKARATTSYTVLRRASTAVSAITSFSNRPLVWIFHLGAAIIVLSGAAGSYLILRRLLFGGFLSGWLSLIISVWFLGGLTIFTIGVLGIYLSKIFLEAKQRPYTIIRKLHERGHD